MPQIVIRTSIVDLVAECLAKNISVVDSCYNNTLGMPCLHGNRWTWPADCCSSCWYNELAAVTAWILVRGKNCSPF